MSSDLPERLRKATGLDLDLKREAAAEIERLRLTDAEREAVEWAVSAARNVEHPAETTLRGLLERLA